MCRIFWYSVLLMHLNPSRLLDSAAATIIPTTKKISTTDWFGALPFIALHLGCFLIIPAGWSPAALIVAFIAYIARGFCITGGYHRYFSHRSYKTGRLFQFLMALVGTMAIQMGPLWWASHHRNHHRYSDQEEDVHSPVSKSFWWSHIGWIMSASSYRNVDEGSVSDLAKFPELRWLDRWCLVPPVLYGIALWGVGSILQSYMPALGTSGLQMLAWGFFVSTVLLYHVTFSVNSVAHVLGSQRFFTRDQSRNNALLALVTMGEGWHNNHHRFPTSERQGIYWWEIDITHYILRLLSLVGIVHSLRLTPQLMINEALRESRAKLR